MISQAEPQVDVFIAVHTPARPIERAVASVLDHTRARVRVTVVAHNVDPKLIENRLAGLSHDTRLRVVRYADAYRSPAGPKNFALELATAPYVTMLDSDDTLEPGALDAWLEAADLGNGARADAVIAPTGSPGSGTTQPSPPIRWHRALARSSSVLHPVRDRLAYRSSPLGLIGRERFAGLRFAEGIQTGEDQPFTATMWFTHGSRVVFPVHAPRYLEHSDQNDRVTADPRAVSEEFRSMDLTFADDCVWMSNPAVRLSLLVKFVRVHYFDALHARVETWDPQTSQEMASVGRRLLNIEPRLVDLLSRADTALFHALLNSETSAPQLQELLVARSRIRSFQALLPQKLRLVLHNQAPLRTHLAGAILLRVMNRRRLRP